MDSLRDLLRHLYQERPPSPSQNCQSVQCDLTYFLLAVCSASYLIPLNLVHTVSAFIRISASNRLALLGNNLNSAYLVTGNFG